MIGAAEDIGGVVVDVVLATAGGVVGLGGMVLGICIVGEIGRRE